MADKILTWNNHPLLYNYKPIVYVRPPGFMSFQTEAYALPFDPAFSLSSGVLEWDLGDVSTNVEANSFSHTYNVSGNKTVNIYRGTTTGANDINAINMSSDDLVGTLDVSSLSNLNSYILVNNNYKLTQILNPTSSGIFTYYNAQDCNLTGVLDVSGLTGLGGNFSIHRNPNLTQILNPTSSEIFSWYSVYSCDLTGTLDISGLSRLGNRVYTVKSNLETKKMKETLARRNAQNKFRKEYGSTYRPSDESRKDNIAYKKLLKAEREKYKDL